jgi:hypothetical protein
MSENKEKNANEKSITSFFENIFSKIKGWFKSAIRYIALSAILFVTVIIGKKTVTKIKTTITKKKNVHQIFQQLLNKKKTYYTMKMV